MSLVDSPHERKWTGGRASDGSSGMFNFPSLEASEAAVVHTLAATATRS